MSSLGRLSLLLCAGALVVGGASAGAFVSLDDSAPAELQSIGFVWAADGEVRIEAAGASAPGAAASWPWSLWADPDDDPLIVYSWLLDSATREPLWVMTYGDSTRDDELRDRRIAEERLRLPAGRYELYLYAGFDWTIGLREEREERSFWELVFGNDRRGRKEVEELLAASFVKLSADGISERDIERFEVDGGLPDARVRLNRIGDTELVRQGFVLSTPARFRVYSLSEKEPQGEQSADYAWIVDESSREVVWSSNAGPARHAGGARKNRLVDTELALDPGRYVVYYGADDSHSFQGFTGGPPHDPVNWGVTLLALGELDPEAFELFEPARVPPLIELVEAGDDVWFERAFRLTEDATLHIQAAGEYARSRDVFTDRAWILDAAGEKVWEMTRENTVGAGGSSKNRRFDGLLRLPRGEYELYYSSDGTHAYDSWNRAAPFEPRAWGVSARPGPGFREEHFVLTELSDPGDREGVLASVLRVGDRERRSVRFVVDRDTPVRVHAVGEGSGGRMYDYGYIVRSASGAKVWEMSLGDTRHAGGAQKNRVADVEITLEAGEYEAWFVTDDSHSFEGWNLAAPEDPTRWGLIVERR